MATPFFSIITLSVAMETSSRIWPNFELIQALIYVIVTCKYEMDQEQPRVSGNNVFPIINLWGFFRRSRAANSAVGGQIWLNFELLRAPMHVIITCKYKKDRDEKRLRKSGNTVFFIITLWELYVAMETRCSRSPISMMFLIKFHCDRPTDCRDIHV